MIEELPVDADLQYMRVEMREIRSMVEKEVEIEHRNSAGVMDETITLISGMKT